MLQTLHTPLAPQNLLTSIKHKGAWMQLAGGVQMAIAHFQRE